MAGHKIINWVTVAPQMFSEKAVNRRRFYPSRLYLSRFASYPLVHQPPMGAILKPRFGCGFFTRGGYHAVLRGS